MNEDPNTIHTDEDDEDNTFCDRSFHRLFGRVATEKFLGDISLIVEPHTIEPHTIEPHP
jgi:hypothetical protein